MCPKQFAPRTSSLDTIGEYNKGEKSFCLKACFLFSRFHIIINLCWCLVPSLSGYKNDLPVAKQENVSHTAQHPAYLRITYQTLEKEMCVLADYIHFMFKTPLRENSTLQFPNNRKNINVYLTIHFDLRSWNDSQGFLLWYK